VTRKVLLAVLVEAAAPAPPAVATPGLREMAVRLLSSLPASPAGAALRTQLAAQPAAAKLRLQAAIREASSAAVAAGPSAAGSAQGPPAAATGGAGLAAPASALASSSGRRPAIHLKTSFALPLPGAK
jgi:hypothetical protein